MDSVNASIEIGAPVQHVWDLATDVEQLGGSLRVSSSSPKADR